MGENFGGVTLAHVIQFQTRILLGAQYGRLKVARDENDGDQVIIACLRMGWNDAFRHVTKNQGDVEDKKKEHAAEARARGSKSYDDYYSSLMGDPAVLTAFKDYARAKSTEDKCACILRHQDALFAVLGKAKKIDDDKRPLCFGHIQKLFNIAVKLYLCVYMCREHLNLDGLFDPEIVDALPYADCPLDSIILDSFEKDRMENEKVNKKKYPDFIWSQITEDKIDTYKDIQEDFRKEGGSGLYYDFTHWNE